MNSDESGGKAGDAAIASSGSAFNLPNALTILRLVLVPIFIWLYLLGTTPARWGALVVFIIASITDYLDGHLARTQKLETDFGRLADPLADKALTLSAFVLLSIDNPFFSWFWIFTALVAFREVLITVLREVLRRRGTVVAASAGGKTKTVLQISLIIGMLAPWASLFDAPEVLTGLTWILGILAVITLVQTLVSGTQYLLAVWRGSHD